MNAETRTQAGTGGAKLTGESATIIASTDAYVTACFADTRGVHAVSVECPYCGEEHVHDFTVGSDALRSAPCDRGRTYEMVAGSFAMWAALTAFDLSESGGGSDAQ